MHIWLKHVNATTISCTITNSHYDDFHYIKLLMGWCFCCILYSDVWGISHCYVVWQKS